MDEVLASVASSADSGRKHQSLSPFKSGAPGETRTPDLLVRSYAVAFRVVPLCNVLLEIRFHCLSFSSAVSGSFRGRGCQNGCQEMAPFSRTNAHRQPSSMFAQYSVPNVGVYPSSSGVPTV